ncbi:hypothetical protein A8B79_02665 [Balneola sp. EhC07]|nr:hypothetical protein A8B79_02665 [Balneola sp. EhC07]
MCTLGVAVGQVNENFSGVTSATGGSAGSYTTKSFTGVDGGTWVATDARTDQTIDGPAILLRNGTLTSPSISGGIGSLTLTTQRAFSGGSGNLTVTVNGDTVGTIAYDGTEMTSSINGINVTGDVVVVIDARNSASDRPVLDDLIWTAYSGSIKDEPTNHATSFTATESGSNAINLTWTDAVTGSQAPDGYVIYGNTDSGSLPTPVDETSPTSDTDLSDGSGIIFVAHGSESASFSGLSENTQYFFQIWSYTNSGSDIDFKTSPVGPTANATTEDAPDIVINEIHADPGTGTDANGDGGTSSTNDEFVEIVNTGTTELDISSWSIEDGVGNRHTFAASTTLQPGQAIVVFGGGTPDGEFGGSLVVTASSGGLGLNNSGDDVILKNNGGSTIASYTYGSEGGDNQSITRSPDLTGAFAKHETADTDDASSFSPGTKIDGSSFGDALTISGTEGWRMLSTPTSDNTYDDLLGDIWTQGIGTGADVTTGTANVQLYNTSTDNFAAATDLGATMTAGTGFITFVYSDDDFTNSGADAGFPKNLFLFGNENSGDVSPTLNTEGDAFTLVGNPYASTIDWDLLTRSDVTGTVYVYDNADSGYDTWNGTTGDLTDGLIATYQGFWVQNTSGSPTPSLTIQEADKSTGGTFRKDVNPSTIKLTTEMEELSANAHFSFTSTGELGKDNFDGLRLDPLDFKEFLSISTLVGDEQLSINNLPADLNEEVTIPMDVEAFTTAEEGWIPKGGEITLTWPELKNLPEHWEITLTDYKTGTTTNILTESSYTFIAEEAKGKVKPKTMFSVLSPVSAVKSKSTNETSRFGITIAPGTSVSIDDEIDAPTEFVLGQNYPNPFNPNTNINYSVGEAGPVNITVYNVMGQKVAELLNTTKNAGNYQITWNATGVASGIYYYRLTAPGQVLTRQMTLIK